jgi:hypothetical protein
LGAPTPLFSSTEQARRIFGLIVRFSNGIALQLRDDPLNFLPFLFSDPGRSDAGSATIVFYRRWQQEPEQPERRMVSTEFPFAVAGL